MNDRDCESCVFDSYRHHGCCSWDCEYINRREAVIAYKEKIASHGKQENEKKHDPN